jgi:phosphoribosylanthranilate isomerase
MQKLISVKVCGLNNPLNVKAISESGADFIGFVFFRYSKRYVGETPDKTLFSNVSEGIKRTGVFVDEQPSKVLELAEYAGLDVIQLHGNESVNYCKSLKAYGLMIIKTFGVGKDFDPRITDHYSEVCDYFLFDTKYEKHGGSGNKFDWGILGNYRFKKPFFLSGGIGPEDTNIKESVLNSQLFAIDINSRFEISTGIKDCESVKNFINEIKRSDI